MATITEALQKAVELQNSGATDSAAKIYEKILEVDANNADALHLLGLIRSSNGDHRTAIELVDKAVSIVPNNAVFFSNFGVTLRRAEEFDRAIDAYKKSLELNPKSADAAFNLGKCYKACGQPVDARSAFELATTLNPRKASAWVSMMNTHVAELELDRAIEIGNRGLSHNSDSALIHINMGVVLRKAKRPDESLSHYRRATLCDPKNQEAWCKLATALTTQHRFEEAAKALSTAQKLAPGTPSYLNAKGLYEKSIGNPDMAVASYQQAISANPSFATAYANLGVAHKQLGSFSSALESLSKALELDADNTEARVNYAAAFFATGRFEAAVEQFESVLKERPDFTDAHDNFLMCMQYHPGVSIEHLHQEHLKWNEIHAASLKQDVVLPNSRDPDRRLKLGFVSADLGNHPVGYFCHQLFQNLNSEEFETYVFSDRIGEDPLGDKLRTLVDHWESTRTLSAESLLAKIRESEIDILFDLAGHTAHHRLLTFARRAAPIQASWAGYVGTTGLGEMDLLISDQFHTPERFDKYYSEKVVRLPDGYICYSPPEYSPEVSPAPPSQNNGFVRFAVVANPAKVNDECLQLWEQILTQVPQSRLQFCYSGWTDSANMERVRAGIADELQDRLEFEFRDGHQNMLDHYSNIDIALDTFPYSGGLTACEALWMGVPTLTMPKDKFCSRHSFSHLSNAGLPELIAKDASDYVAKAVSLAGNSKRLEDYRTNLRSAVRKSPLCDGPRFALNMARNLREQWRIWCRSDSSSEFKSTE